MKISLGSWAFSFGPFADHPIPFEETVKRLSKAGYDGIEICGFPPHVTLENYPTRESRRGLAGFLADHSLGVSGYAADFTWVNPVSQGNKQKYLDLFRRNVELCADIGSPGIRVDSIAAPGSIDDRDYLAAFTRLAGVWREAAEIARKAGVRMLWEFEPGFAFNKPSEVLAMHNRVGHPNFQLLFDTAHAYMCGVIGSRQYGEKETLPGGVAEFLKLLNGRIGAIHLIDSDGTLYGDETSTHRPFGEGRIDFRALAPKLLAVPGIEWWCIDMCFLADSWDLVDSSRQFVEALLPGRS
ncbi:MAG: sugar phosphate isomerase/epimerase [Bryobacteraceae bacterium]